MRSTDLTGAGSSVSLWKSSRRGLGEEWLRRRMIYMVIRAQFRKKGAIGKKNPPQA